MTNYINIRFKYRVLNLKNMREIIYEVQLMVKIDGNT